MTPRQFIRKTYGHHVTNGKGLDNLLIKYAELMLNLREFSRDVITNKRSATPINHEVSNNDAWTTLHNTKTYISLDDVEACVRAYIRQYGITTDLLFGTYDDGVLTLSSMVIHTSKRSALFNAMLSKTLNVVHYPSLEMIVTPSPQDCGTNTQRISYINYVIDNLC